MGYDLLATVFFALMLPLVLLGFVLFWVWTARDRRKLESTWEGYAASRGLTFVPGEGDWPNRRSPAIVWSADHASFRLFAVGTERNVRTRVTVRPRSTLLGTLAMIVDRACEGGLRVRERPLGFGNRILTEPMRRVLLGFAAHEGLRLSYRRGRATLEWPGGETNDALLDDARRVAEALASAIDQEFRHAAKDGGAILGAGSFA